MRLSACLVIHNEEKLLPRCLESIKNIVDEIIVIHDGPCSDDSLEIAKRFGAKVFIRPYIGEAEYNRPFSYEKASGEWILQIDADEFLSDKAKIEIPKLVKSKDIDAFSFLWPYKDLHGYIKKGPFAVTLKPCLFRKKKMFMIGISHEYPRSYGRLKKLSDVILEHHQKENNYTRKSFQQKWLEWAKLQAKQIFYLEKAPTYNIDKLESNQIYLYYLNMRKFPIISGLREMVKFLIIYLTRGIIWSGLSSFKIAYFEQRYLWLVRIYLWRLKHGQQI